MQLARSVHAAFLAAAVFPLASGAACLAPQTPDWIDAQLAADPNRAYAAMTWPAAGAVVKQRLPDFSWPLKPGATAYTVCLTLPGGAVQEFASTLNYFNWPGDPATLPDGTYKWTVKPSNGNTSTERTFTVNAASLPFKVPALSSVKSYLSAKARPRGIPASSSPLWTDMRNQRAADVTALRNEVDNNETWNANGPTGIPSGTLPNGYDQGYGKTSGEKTLRALMAHLYATTQADKDRYLLDAKTRLMNMASWPVRGTNAGSHREDLESAFVALVITLGYDWLGSGLSSSERQTIATNLKIRLGDYNARLTKVNEDPQSPLQNPLWKSIYEMPRVSHPAMNAQQIAMATALLVGDPNFPDAGTWFDNLMPWVVNTTMVWGKEDGGYVQGTAQTLWDVSWSLTPWHVLWYATSCDTGNAACLDFSKKAWVRNYADSMPYFNAALPSAANEKGLFGDGYSMPSHADRWRVAQGLASLAPTPLACWYAATLAAAPPENYSVQHLMGPPRPAGCNATFPAGAPNARDQGDVGWVAMHSDLASTSRNSVYFKSSPAPFGAVNHSHAAQNSFVIDAGGEHLAIESGYYDDGGGGYGSNHWRYWMTQTLSKNAITHSDGQGQRFDINGLPMGYGKITQRTSAADHEVVMADARDAWDPTVVNDALRSLVYLRPGSVLVYDRVGTPGGGKVWEWNIHGLLPRPGYPDAFQVISPTRLRIVRGSQTLCVDMLQTPALPAAERLAEGSFAAHSAWPSNAGASGEAQMHGRFSTASRTSAEMIALMRINVACNSGESVPPTPTKSGTSWQVVVDGKQVTIGPSSDVGGGSGIPVPGAWASDAYKPGGQGVGYYDTTAGNVNAPNGCTEDDVDSITDPQAGCVVNNFANGEWMAYDINVTPSASGRYDLGIEYSNNYGTSVGEFFITIDGVDVTGTVYAPITGAWNNFAWAMAVNKTINLTPGHHVLKVHSQKQWINVNSVKMIANP